MTIAAAIQNTASGDNLLGHTVIASTLGGGFSSTIVWALQTFAHVNPDPSVAQWFTAVGIVAASWILRRVSQ